MLFPVKKTLGATGLASFAVVTGCRLPHTGYGPQPATRNLTKLCSLMKIIASCVLALFLLACAGDPADQWNKLDLMKYQIPVTIMAPDSAKVNATNLSGIMQDVTIKSPADRYSVQVLASQASTNDMTRLKAEQLELVRDNRYFETIVREEPNGFVFQNRIDTTSIYGFRHIIYQGDQEFVFQNSFDGTFSLAEVEAMYAAVKQQKK